MHTFAAGSVLPGASLGSLAPRAVRSSGRIRAPASIVAMAKRKKRKEKSRRKENEGGSAPAPAAPAPAAPAQNPAAASAPAPAAPAGRARDNEIDWAEIERNNEQARAAMGTPSTPAPAGDGLLERAFSADAQLLFAPWWILQLQKHPEHNRNQKGPKRQWRNAESEGMLHCSARED